MITPMLAPWRMVCAAVITESARQTMPLDVCPNRPSTATMDLPAWPTASDTSFENRSHTLSICSSPVARVLDLSSLAHHPNGQAGIEEGGLSLLIVHFGSFHPDER